MLDKLWRKIGTHITRCIWGSCTLPKFRDNRAYIKIISVAEVIWKYFLSEVSFGAPIYNIPFSYDQEVRRQMKEMLERGIIKTEAMGYISPLITVKKKISRWAFVLMLGAWIREVEKISWFHSTHMNVFTHSKEGKY